MSLLRRNIYSVNSRIIWNETISILNWILTKQVFDKFSDFYNFNYQIKVIVDYLSL